MARVADKPRLPMSKRTRHALVADLFLQRGTFWANVAQMRAEYSVSAERIMPPELTEDHDSVTFPEVGTFHLHTPRFDPYLTDFPAWMLDELSRLPQTRAMAELVLDPIAGQKTRGMVFVEQLAAMWRNVPGNNLSGTDVLGHVPWLPFLSACMLFDPPPAELLAFADQHSEADVVAMPTFWREPEAVVAAELSVRAYLATGDVEAWNESVCLHQEALRPSDLAKPEGRAGRKRLDELECIQSAIWCRQGLTYAEITKRGNWPFDSDSKHGKNPSRDRVTRGEEVLSHAPAIVCDLLSEI